MPLPIEDYALIGDRHTAALVGKDGSIDWLCLPRFDSPACFSALLGTPDHGRWLIAPTQEFEVSRRYIDDSSVLETTFTTQTGEVTLVDLMPSGDNRADVVRQITGVRGTVSVEHEWVVRPGYGSSRPWVRRYTVDDDEVITAISGPDQLILRGSRLPRAVDGRHRDEFEVEVRRHPRRREGQHRARLDVELVGVPVVARGRQTGAAKHEQVGSADGGDHGLAVDGQAAHPRDHRAIVEADHPLVPHPHRAAHAHDPAYDVGPAVAAGHQVGEADDPGAGRERRLQGGGRADIAAADVVLLDRAELPVTVLLGAEQRREARRGVEARQAQPVDRSVAADQGARLPVADQGVLLDR